MFQCKVIFLWYVLEKSGEGLNEISNRETDAASYSEVEERNVSMKLDRQCCDESKTKAKLLDRSSYEINLFKQRQHSQY